MSGVIGSVVMLCSASYRRRLRLLHRGQVLPTLVKISSGMRGVIGRLGDC